MVQGNSLGLPHFEAPVATNSIGTFFWFMYLSVAPSSYFFCANAAREPESIVAAERPPTKVRLVVFMVILPVGFTPSTTPHSLLKRWSLASGRAGRRQPLARCLRACSLAFASGLRMLR